MSYRRRPLFLACMALVMAPAGAVTPDQAAIHLDFEGEVAPNPVQPTTSAWANKGTVGTGETPGVVGQLESPPANYPGISSNGLRGGEATTSGQCYDGTANTPGTPENSYLYGSRKMGSPTPIEQALTNTWAFTITGWYYAPGAADVNNQRILRSNAFEVNYNQNRLAVKFGRNGDFINSNTSPAAWRADQGWVFFAITYDGTVGFDEAGGKWIATADNIKFYAGRKDQPVTLQYTGKSVMKEAPGGEAGNIPVISAGAPLVVGNVDIQANRPFAGYLDELRVYSTSDPNLSQPSNEKVLTLEQIEKIRRHDVGMPSEPM